MVVVDTNVLIRALVDDASAPEQVAAARRFVQSLDRVYVTQIVQIECVWVLSSAYGFTKREILEKLTQLAGLLRYKLQNKQRFLTALETFRSCRADFADCLNLAEAGAQNCDFVTFDKALVKAGARALSV